MSGMLDAGAGGAVIAGCDDISLHVRPPESLAGGFLSFGLTGMPQLCAEFFGNGWSSRRWHKLDILVYGEEDIDEEDRQFGLLMRWRELGYSDSGKSG